MEYAYVVDSTTFRLSKINPNTGVVTYISPSNIGAGGNLTGGAFIDPNSMTYFFSHGNKIVGVSLITGLITSSVTKSFDSGAFAFDMMRSTQNCMNAAAIRMNNTSGINENVNNSLEGLIFPNPAQNKISIKLNSAISKIEILDAKGQLVLLQKENMVDISNLPSGIYFAKVLTENGKLFSSKFVKN
jgi:hypothetical protein